MLVEEFDPFEAIEPKGCADIRGPQPKRKTTSVFDSLKGDVPEWVDNYQPKSKPNDHNKRSKDLLEKHGFTWGKCEAYNSFSGKKTDLFGCMDYMAMSPVHGIVGVQVTSYKHAGDRFTKARKGDLKTWLESGGRFVVLGWAKGKNGRWNPYCIWAALEGGEVVKKASWDFEQDLGAVS